MRKSYLVRESYLVRKINQVRTSQVAPSGGQICNYCKWRYVVAKFSPSLGVNFWVRCASGNVYFGGFPQMVNFQMDYEKDEWSKYYGKRAIAAGWGM